MRKDHEGDQLKRALDSKPAATKPTPRKPFWLRRDIPAKKGQ